jgi:peptide/nickel transport system permease protein
MTTYLIRRSIQGFVVLIFATAITYFLLSQIPMASCNGEVAGGAPLTPRQCMELRKDYRLDKPWYERYFYWLFDPGKTRPQDNPIDIRVGELRIHGSGMLTGNWSRSLIVAQGQPVIELIKSRLPQTLILMITALLTSLLLAFPIGVLAAMRQYSRLDYSVTMFSFFGISMPSFWFGLMLIILFAVKFKEWGLPYLPTGDMADAGMEGDLANRLRHLILPVTVLSLGFVAGWSRYIRASMLEVLRQDYVRTAWAKGLQQRVVILKHVLRNTLIPLITIIGLAVPGLFGGAIITETIFNYPGMGRLYLAALNNDWPLVMGILVITTVLVVVSNLLADVLYAVADPRIRYS